MIARREVPGAVTDRLYFAQVREDPEAELRALAPGADDRVVIISSGGCTALSLLAAGAGEVHAVDVNRTQNHLVELKVAALRRLPLPEALAFIGGVASSPVLRRTRYSLLREELSVPARDYWDAHPGSVGKGILNAGASERFIALVVWVLTNVVQSPERVERLLACRTIEEQRDLFDREWNTWRWRALFSLLLNKWAMSRAYDPAFFARVGRGNFSDHFRALADHALRDLPIGENYFLRQMLTGVYDPSPGGARPPYLTESGAQAVASRSGRLRLVDGSVLEHLRTLPDQSVACIGLSNVCEWMTPDDIRALFAEVERVATPDARIVFRNFVGWTDLASTGSSLIEDGDLGELLSRSDRSVVQARVAICRPAAALAEIGV